VFTGWPQEILLQIPTTLHINSPQKVDKVINNIINTYSKERVTNMPHVVTTLEHPPYNYDLSPSD